MEFQFTRDQRAQWTEVDAGLWSYEIPEGWGQGRSVYGGLTTSIASALVLRHAPEGYTLRSSNVLFLRPMVPGQALGRVEEIRRGKYTSFWEVRLVQGGEEALRVQVILGKGREGAIHVDGPVVEFAKPVEELQDLPYIPNVTPEFIKHMRMRWAEGSYPYAGAKDAAFAGYCAYKVPADGEEGILGLLDAWPCPSLSLLKQPRPASSITWSAHIVSVPESMDGWFRFRYRTVVGAGGFHRCIGELADEGGNLVAWTEQLVAVFG